MKGMFKVVIISLSISLLSIIVFSGCSNSLTGWKLEWVDGLFTCYNIYSKEAFAGDYQWNGEESNMTITIPDDYRGYKINALGGISNRNYCFGVLLPQELNGKKRLPYETQVPYEPNADNTVVLTFTIKLGKNINTLKYIEKGLSKYAKDDNLEHCTFYTVKYYYICGEENETFYSEDGVLYLKSDGSKAAFENGEQ